MEPICAVRARIGIVTHAMGRMQSPGLKFCPQSMLSIANFNILVNKDSLYQRLNIYTNARILLSWWESNVSLVDVTTLFNYAFNVSCLLRFHFIVLQTSKFRWKQHFEDLPKVFQEFCSDFTMFYREYRRVSYLKSCILISLRMEITFPPNQYFSSTKSNRYFGIRSNLHDA